MKEIMHYFGTSKSDAGHYVWKVGEHSIYGRDLNLRDFPFDLESLPRCDENGNRRKGTIRFYKHLGYSICAIEGSCKDQRWGTKSVFFTKQDLTVDELWQMVIDTPPLFELITNMPFELNRATGEYEAYTEPDKRR